MLTLFVCAFISYSPSHIHNSFLMFEYAYSKQFGKMSVATMKVANNIHKLPPALYPLFSATDTATHKYCITFTVLTFCQWWQK